MSETYPISWDATGEHYYETGVKNGVLYPYDITNKRYSPGVAWNGLTAVTESPSGADETALYADDIKYLSLRATEEFGCTIESYTYPDEFAACDGSAFIDSNNGVSVGQQKRGTFGISYRTKLSNDSNAEYYKLHLIYGLTASPSERAYQTINDSPEAITFSWEASSVPIKIGGGKNPTSIITIDSSKADSTKLKALEDKLYGTATYEACTSSSTYSATTDYYTQSGDDYILVDISSTTFNANKTDYYTVSSSVAAYLPMPSEVIGMFTAS